MAKLTVRGITRGYGGEPIVEDFDLQVGAGKALALIGPNGAGKTTLFNLIAGALAPDAGRITKNAAATIVYLAQDAAPDPASTPIEAVTAAALEHHAHGRVHLAQAAVALRALGERGVGELLHDLELVRAVQATVLIGGHGSLPERRGKHLKGTDHFPQP